MTWTRVQKSTAYATTATGTLPSNATAGNLVVAFVHSTTNTAFTGPPGLGWYQGPVNGLAGSRTEIWYLPPQSNFGGFSSVTFGVSGTIRCAMAEYHTDVTRPMVVIDAQGGNNNAAATSLTVTEGGSNAAGGLGVCGFLEHFGAGTAVTWTDPTGFTVSNSMTASNANQAYCADDLSVASGTLSVIGSTGVSGAWSGGLIVFKAITTPALAIFISPLQRPRQVRHAIVARAAPGAPTAPPLAAAPTSTRRRAQVQALRAHQAVPGSPPSTPLPPAAPGEKVRRQQARARRPASPPAAQQRLPAPASSRARRLPWTPARRTGVPAPSGGIIPPPSLPRAPQRPGRPPWRPIRRPPVPVPSGGVSQPLPASAAGPRRPARRPPLRSQPAPAPRGQAASPAAGRPLKRPARRLTTALRAAAAPVRALAPPSYRRAPWRPVQRRSRPVPFTGPGIPVTVPVTVADPLAIVDTISVFTGIEWGLDACRLQWAATAARGQWAIEEAEQWAASSVAAQWAVDPSRAQWRILMADFDPIAAISQEAVPVAWISEIGGVTFDPTNPAGDGSLPALAVSFAFPPSSGNAHAPAEPVTWFPAAWVVNTTSRGHFAECMTGPGTTGPTLVAGTAYDVWSKVAVGASNNVVKFAGTILAY